ncbi:EAL domain-containing protein [Anaerolentibacter hominis]|uniref:EAL domain-containing protein n=1 Tax=Anaerolentibacter hominis TaxID=3079009 RepID=UPI0031B886BA
MGQNTWRRDHLEKLAGELVGAYFEVCHDRDIVRLLSPDICWIETGNDVIYHTNKAIAEELSGQQFTKGAFIIEEHYETIAFCTELACVVADLKISAGNADKITRGIPLRFSILFQRGKDGIQIVHAHNSIPNPGQAGQEDALTGIWNMEGFVRETKKILERNDSQQYVLIKINLNRFQRVNRLYGYSFGDRVLKNIAENLLRCCGRDELCCRLEKDNFALLWKYEDKEQLDQRMTQTREVLLDQRIKEVMTVELTFSGGIYLLQDREKETIKDMLDKAAVALDSLTGKRENEYAYFEPDMYRRKEFQNRLMQEAPQALKKKEFQLYIQPQVDVKTERIVAGEALVRWKRENGVLLMPRDFIPLFEQEGLILELDFYMLELVCARIRKWLDLGYEPARLSVNQSRLHVKDAGYIDRFCEITKRYAIPNGTISFELTESAFIENEDDMYRVARELHEKGFALEIDDFGTGYASLSIINRLEADVLKIDKSLLEGLKDEAGNRSYKILKKVIEMAHETGMQVTCEGVEKREQVECLKKLGCDMVQGFYYGRPMPAEEFGLVMQKNKSDNIGIQRRSLQDGKT